ncbi:DNA alkylation repair protein [Ornithinimicrobium faecis]|uniref:DNA alkylation repair protein n=1 Tax=Ornithinimicrobium faecis TaxID=2934158 RepID=A0ABY4YT12_9MICO|nr:DNA alkylation repair protein [Ornithinimicrobium sp. HY1793]USQ79914.1 DNA alkylation repair protein [Ornithinimicrobium sp. HY1793]
MSSAPSGPTTGAPAPPGPALIAEIRAALAAAGDPERAVGQQRYMKSSMPFRGLTSPVLKATLRPILSHAAYDLGHRTTWEATVRALWDGAAFREERHAALAVAGHRRYAAFRDVNTLPLHRDLAQTGAWWDFVDDISSHHVAPVLLADRAGATPVVREWATDDDLWVRRVAILSQLPAKAETDTRLLAQALDANLPGSAFGSEFFIRKAIGWALREFAKTDPQWVRDYVADRELSALSRREALKHLG